MAQKDLIEAFGDDATRLASEMKSNDDFADAISAFWNSFAGHIDWVEVDAFAMQAVAHLLTLREDHDVLRERQKQFLSFPGEDESLSVRT